MDNDRSNCPNYKDESTEKKISQLMSKMTLEEKVGQMQQYALLDMKQQETFEMIARQGKAGSFYNLYGAELYNHMQRIAVEESRLGIPIINACDALHGYKTIFPIPLGEASTWDPNILEKAAEIVAEEAAATGFHWLYSPMLDIARDPRWGRMAEGEGEDPYLCGRISEAKVRGLQRNNWNGRPFIVSCPKHYAGYGAAEGGRDYNTAEISEKTLREVYLPPFKAAFDAGAGTVMASFNDFNGMPVTANKFLLNDILRGEWDFDGIIVSDYSAINELVDHGLAADLKEAVVKAVNAGIDVDLAGEVYNKYLVELVQEGRISEEKIDQSVRRILRLKYWLGLFDNPYIETERGASVLLSTEKMEWALNVARKSVVLLKNENNILPLSKKIGTIALIGPLADNKKEVLGCWAHYGDADNAVTVLQGIKDKLAPDADIIYARGCDISPETKVKYVKGTLQPEDTFTVYDENDTEIVKEIEKAVAVARRAEIAVVVVGEKALMSGEAQCRSSLDLPGHQQKLVKAVFETGTPTIVVLMNGRPLSIPWIDENIPAILETWHLGLQTGNAIADILFGDCNPGGKLPVSFPRTVGQVPVYYNHKSTGRPPAYDTLSSRYNDVAIAPLYPFGYGLSYTRFEYSDLKISSRKIKASENITVSADVANAGGREGDEVVQLYIKDVAASTTRPVKELKGFEKITLSPGEKRRVSFVLTPEDLAFYDDSMSFVVEPGLFKVWIGTNSQEGLEGFFEVI